MEIKTFKTKCKHRGNVLPLVIAGVFLISLAHLFAEIQVVSAEVTTIAPAGATSVSANFRLKNTGGKPIKIQRMEADCSCVTVGAKEKVIAPSKELAIKAVFEIGKRTGEQKKTIILFSDDPKDSVISLRWNIKVPNKQ